MNIHLAGIEGFINNSFKYENLLKYDNFLISYAYYAKTKNEQNLKVKVEKTLHTFHDKKILLDSGAFSRSNNVVDFSLQDYINFLHKYGHLFWRYITLDIPMRGELTKSKCENSLIETEENLLALEKEGLNPVPVYQRYWNRYDILEKYLEKYEYICIGGTATGIHDDRENLLLYLDTVFEMNSKYERKLHGLGQTTDFILKQYPFYSVDSTSWLYGARDCFLFIHQMDGYKIIETTKKEYNQYVLSPTFFDGYKNYKYPPYITRCDYNIKFYYNYQRILRELWNERGVSWSEYTLSGSSK